MEFQILNVPQNNSKGESKINILRIDPYLWELIFAGLSQADKGSTKTAKEWLESHKLVAAINAGIFATDYRTHTGYLKYRDHVNSRYFNNYQSVLAFDPPEYKDLPPFRIYDLNDRISCLPLLIYHIDKTLLNSLDADFGKVISDKEVNGILNSKIDIDGFLIILAEHLRICKDLNMQVSLRRFMIRLMKAHHYPYEVRKKLWLNLISNDRLFFDPGNDGVEEKLNFDYDWHRIIAPYDLFFDSNGKRRLVANLEWEGDPEYFPTILPDDLVEAFNYASFLKSKNVKPKFLNELQKRLFDKAETE